MIFEKIDKIRFELNSENTD